MKGLPGKYLCSKSPRGWWIIRFQWQNEHGHGCWQQTPLNEELRPHMLHHPPWSFMRPRDFEIAMTRRRRGQQRVESENTIKLDSNHHPSPGLIISSDVSIISRSLGERIELQVSTFPCDTKLWFLIITFIFNYHSQWFDSWFCRNWKVGPLW